MSSRQPPSNSFENLTSSINKLNFFVLKETAESDLIQSNSQFKKPSLVGGSVCSFWDGFENDICQGVDFHKYSNYTDYHLLKERLDLEDCLDLKGLLNGLALIFTCGFEGQVAAAALQYQKGDAGAATVTIQISKNQGHPSTKISNKLPSEEAVRNSMQAFFDESNLDKLSSFKQVVYHACSRRIEQYVKAYSNCCDSSICCRLSTYFMSEQFISQWPGFKLAHEFIRFSKILIHFNQELNEKQSAHAQNPTPPSSRSTSPDGPSDTSASDHYFAPHETIAEKALELVEGGVVPLLKNAFKDVGVPTNGIIDALHKLAKIPRTIKHLVSFKIAFTDSRTSIKCSFYNPKQKAHCEMHLADYLWLEMNQNKKQPKQPYRYIGCSKFSCTLCWFTIQTSTPFQVNESHLKVYPGWHVPEGLKKRNVVANALLQDNQRRKGLAGLITSWHEQKESYSKAGGPSFHALKESPTTLQGVVFETKFRKLS